MPRTRPELQTAIEAALTAELSASAESQASEPSLQDDGDILPGASAIAGYLFGDKKKIKKVYGLVQRGLLPVFYWGSLLCARKSSLNRTINARERATISAIQEMRAAAE
jgi:hypothetical protein